MCFYLKILECVLPKNKDILLHKNKMLIKIRKLILCCSVAQSCLTLCDPMDCSTPGFPVLYYLLEFSQVHVHWVITANHLILCWPLILLPSIFPNIGVFSIELVLCIGWPKYWSFSVSLFIENSHRKFS